MNKEKETKIKTIERVSKKFLILPDHTQSYIEGIMQGYLVRIEEEKKEKQTA